MENIYEESLGSIKKYGAKFSIDLKKRNFKFNGKYVIKNAEYIGELGIEKCQSSSEFLSEVERLYERFKNSIPTADDQSVRKGYFKALKESDVNEEDMWFGESRCVTRFELEMYVLSQIILGFEWQEDFGKWFWQSEKDKDLVLLKDWF